MNRRTPAGNARSPQSESVIDEMFSGDSYAARTGSMSMRGETMRTYCDRESRASATSTSRTRARRCVAVVVSDAASMSSRISDAFIAVSSRQPSSANASASACHVASLFAYGAVTCTYTLQMYASGSPSPRRP
ncbi:MAG: hypothetical protein ACKV2T_08175 [Kofleriaceae bacterium]